MNSVAVKREDVLTATLPVVLLLAYSHCGVMEWEGAAEPSGAGPSSANGMDSVLAMDDAMDEEEARPLVPTPRQKRPLPHKFDGGQMRVVCHNFPSAASGSDRQPGRAAQLCFFLPHNWSASYKFTVFENSYIVAFPAAGEMQDRPATEFHLARPVEARSQLTVGGVVSRFIEGGVSPPFPEFELVWPIQLDRTLLDAVRLACERTQLGCKRKPHEQTCLESDEYSTVNLKLRKLGL